MSEEEHLGSTSPRDVAEGLVHRTISPDWRWFWDGTQWLPMPALTVPRRVWPTVIRWIAGAFLVFIGVLVFAVALIDIAQARLPGNYYRTGTLKAVDTAVHDPFGFPYWCVHLVGDSAGFQIFPDQFDQGVSDLPMHAGQRVSLLVDRADYEGGGGTSVGLPCAVEVFSITMPNRLVSRSSWADSPQYIGIPERVLIAIAVIGGLLILVGLLPNVLWDVHRRRTQMRRAPTSPGAVDGDRRN